PWNPRTLAQVKAASLANGPMGNADFEGRRPAGASGWWKWRPTQHALHYLWMTGALTIHSRRHFHKRFDVMERALPAALACEPVSAEEFSRWHVERSLHAMGAATAADLVGYLTFPRFFTDARRAGLRALLARGDVTEIEVEGRPGRWLASRATCQRWLAPRARRRPPAARRSSPRSTRCSGIAGEWHGCSASTTGSRSTRRAPSVCTATTRCRSCTTGS